MIKNHLTRKTIAVFLFLFSLININAQGPKSPEAAAFEPVDADDMVNLSSGDFSYVLPLMEVPSPEGGYPIVLSYHAGIAVDQEASWVGLGWSLNPGAINREIGGYADDWKNGKTSSIFYDKGGESTTYSIGESVGISDLLSVGRTLSFTENRTYGGETTYRFDVDYNVNLGFKGSHFGINASIGTSGVGLGIGASMSKNSYGAGIGVNFRQSFINGRSSFSSSAYLSVNSKRALGISFSSVSKLGASIGSRGIGLSGTSNNTNNVSYNNTSIDISIPIIPAVYNVNFGYHRSRYWLFDNQFNDCYGSLYSKSFKTAREVALNPSKTLYDNGESLYKFDKEEQSKENNLAYLTKDSYKVTGQGIYGSISPKFHDLSTLLLKNISGETYFLGKQDITLRNLNDSNNDLFFSFDNSFSSFLRMKSGLWQVPTSPDINDITDVPVTGRSLLSSIEIDGEIKSGYDNIKSRKKVGNYVEVFTNSEITPSNIIEVSSESGFNRNYLKSKEGVKDGIGAYRITTTDGRTYHYSLPVYQKEKFSRNSRIEKSDEIQFREEMSLTPYATHWLLTAITGPDYVDSNNDGKLNNDDYGYWVEFEYGKWSDGYTWSSPSNEVISNSSKNNLTYFKSLTNKSYSWGVKELYYLDKIRTRTHTALFIKENRSDNTSTEVYFNNVNYVNRQIKNGQVINGVTYVSGFENSKYNWSKYSGFDLRYAEGHYDYSVNLKDQKSLRLKEILIVKNENLNGPLNKSKSGKSNKNIGSVNIKQINKFFRANNGVIGQEVLFDINNNYYGENYNNVIDYGDVNLESKAEKVIEFKYATYNQLARNSPNSSEGKLTLNSLLIKGKSGLNLMPPYEFTYNKNFPYNYNKMNSWGYYENHPDAWSLTNIETPIGADIKINYESDDYDEEVVGENEIFHSGFQFIFEEYNGKLRIRIYNEDNSKNIINFLEKFQLGKVNTDIWVCRRRDYFDFECKSRVGNIDIQDQNLNVISVSSTELVLESSLSVVGGRNSGLGELYGSVVGLNNHPGNIRVDAERGVCIDPDGCINVSPRLVLEYLIKSNKANKIGGGLRVKQLELVEGSSSTYTNYYYNAENSDKNRNELNYKSSGVTSYVPSKFFKEVKYISELPTPSVMYNRVTVENIDSNGKSEFETIYKFKTLNTNKLIDNDSQFTIPDLLDIRITQEFDIDGVNVNSERSFIGVKKYEIKNSLSSLGSLISKSIVTGNNHILQETKNEFHDLSEINQGINEESSVYYKRLVKENKPTYLVNSTSKVNYSIPLKAVTTSQGTFSSTKYFDKYDFLTGQVLETRSYDSDGKVFKSKIIPAYTKYSEMGSKIDNMDNKNMLSQSAGEINYIFKNNEWKEIGANITTWNNSWVYPLNNNINESSNDVWRKHKTFVWNGNLASDNTYDNFVEFNYTPTATNTNWRKISETTKYNQFSHPLEVKDINNNYAATRMGDNYSKVIATSNTAYEDMYYSGAEYIEGSHRYFEGNVLSATTGRNRNAHTGKYSVQIDSGKKSFEVEVPRRTERNTDLKRRFKVSIWVRKGDENRTKILVNNTQKPFNNAEKVYAGGWVQLNGYITIPTNGTSVAIKSTSGTIYADDFRLHPISSSMTSYVYNEWDEVSYIMGANGLSTHYIYDAAGRLIETQVEAADKVSGDETGGFKKVSKNSYNYKHNNN